MPTTIILSLTDKVEKKSGYPQEWLKSKTGRRFITVKKFIDNPETAERFRYINLYNKKIQFSDEVKEYVKKKFSAE